MNPKIYIIVYNIFGIGGTVRTSSILASELTKRNYPVEIISLKKNTGKPKLYLHPKIKINAINSNAITRKDTGFYPFLRRSLLKIRKSKVFANDEDLYCNINFLIDKELINELDKIDKGIVIGTIPSLNRLISHKFHLNKNIVTVGQEHKGFNDHTIKIQKIIARYYRDLDFLTILTEKNRKTYERFNSNVHVLGNATYNVPYKAALDTKKLIFLGRLVPQKGVDLLIDALHEQQFFSRYPDYIIELFGQGRLKSKIQRKLRKYGLSSSVILKDAVTNIYPNLLDSEIMLIPSRYEPFGMVLIEAMSCGLPIVSFNTEGPTEIIKDNGILVGMGDKKGFIKAVETILENQQLKKRMGQRSKEIFNEKYAVDKFIDYWEKNIIIPSRIMMRS